MTDVDDASPAWWLSEGALIAYAALALTVVLIAPHVFAWRQRTARRTQLMALLQRSPCTLSLPELRNFTGQDGVPILVSMDGRIFDMTSAPEFYGKGSGYHVYAGREAGRALGKMTLINNKPQHAIDLREPWVDDLDAEQRKTKADWIKKFETKYKLVGTIRREPGAASTATAATRVTAPPLLAASMSGASAASKLATEARTTGVAR